MLSELGKDIDIDEINRWQNATWFEDLKHLPAPPSKVRDINVGYFEVTERRTDGIHFFEKSTDIPIAILEKLNSDLAVQLGLSVAPCVISNSKPQPTLVSLGLYPKTLSILQNERRLFLDRLSQIDQAKLAITADGDPLYNFARYERSNHLEIMKNDVTDDLHPGIRPYRALLSESLPFLLWTRVHDPNLSNIMDIERIAARTNRPRGGYLIDLEGDPGFLTNGHPLDSDWSHQTIHQQDLGMVLKDWLATKLPIESTFDASRVWRTVNAIQSVSDDQIRAEQEKCSLP